MFKKIINICLIFIVTTIIGVVTIGASESNHVKDYLNYLTDHEINQLEQTIDTIRDEYSLDVVIVIVDDTEGKSSMDFADDYYDYNGYGIGEDYSGLLMLINMDQREVWISTTGRAIDIFTDSRISNMVNNIVGPLSEGRYYEASYSFLSDTKSYAKQGVPRNQYRVDGVNEIQNNTAVYVKPTYFQKVMSLIQFFPIYIVAFVISVVTTVLLSLSRKGKITINRQTYEKNNSFRLSEVTDRYIRQTTTRTKIHRNSGGGSGGSSVHTGSSGRSHGGGGGRF